MSLIAYIPCLCFSTTACFTWLFIALCFPLITGESLFVCAGVNTGKSIMLSFVASVSVLGAT